MKVQKNVCLTSARRKLLVKQVRSGWLVKVTAEAAGVSRRMAHRWLKRDRRGCKRRLQNRSSAPRRSPRRTPVERIGEIERLRRQRRSGPAIARLLGIAHSMVGVILRRLGLGKLAALDPKPPIVRYEKAHPGELIHLDIKTSGKIEGVGCEHRHVAIDDASRSVDTEVLPSLGQQDATALLERALAWFQRFGIKVQRVMTDNRSAHRSKLFAKALRDSGARHIPTRPYTPRTNGKAEHFIQTSLREWAHAQPYASLEERTAAGPWTDSYIWPDPTPASQASFLGFARTTCLATILSAPHP